MTFQVFQFFTRTLTNRQVCRHFRPATGLSVLIILTVPLLVLLLALPITTQAWPGHTKKPDAIENFEPPAEDAEKAQCTPIEQSVYRLNQHTPKYLRIFIVPEREYLMAKHRRCKESLMNQEYQYLKHADLKNPTLESLPEASTPAFGTGSAHTGKSKTNITRRASQQISQKTRRKKNTAHAETSPANTPEQAGTPPNPQSNALSNPTTPEEAIPESKDLQRSP